MLKVIIVDDEQRIVEMIRRLIDWEAMGFQVIDVAYNGPDAFSLVAEKHPDVVIADVRMPGYDGIELIRRCHDAEYYPNFIIVSGYRFFEYAHNALRYGVEHYLLKPLDRQELIQALEIVRTKCYAEQEREREALEQEQRDSASSRAALRRRLILDGLTSGQFPAGTEEANRDYGTAFQSGKDFCFTAVFLKLFSLSGARVTLAPVLNRICADFPQHLDVLCTEHIEAPYNAGVLCVLNLEKNRLPQLDSAVRDLFTSLQQRTEMFGHFSPAIGIGACSASFSDLPQLIDTARTAVLYTLDFPQQSLIRYDNYSYTRLPVSRIYTPEVARLLLSAVEEGEEERIRKYYNGCVSRIDAIANRCPSMLYDFIRAILDGLTQYIQNTQLDRTELDGLLTRLGGVLDHRCTEKELTEGALLVLLELSQLISHQRYLEYSKPIRTARKYIDEHYMEQLTLDELADMVHLSSSYLSTVFKEETGLGFSDYLINCRISAAKELLRKTDMRLPDIAEAIGYKDSKHFGKLFKKVAGIKPSDFRKLYS